LGSSDPLIKVNNIDIFTEVGYAKIKGCSNQNFRFKSYRTCFMFINKGV
jgi:hypothetical protein